MVKRRISKLQKRRINDRQKQYRENFKDGFIDISKHGQGHEHSGQVITNFGQNIIVEDVVGNIYRCFARQNLGAIVCGDYVVWQQDGNSENVGIVVAVSKRKTLLQKPVFGGKLKPVAANIDQIVVVSSLLPEPNCYLIDRYLVAAENLPAEAVIVLNKIDLVDSENCHVVENIEHEYKAIGYKVIKTSHVCGSGFDSLRSVLEGKTTIFVGLSGVGKSSLIKYLLPDQDVRIEAVSQATGEGVHTTTNSTLYHLPNRGGKLIDSPGVRDFGLWKIAVADVLYGFKEFRPYIGNCRFSNCRHQSEPGCAIRDALSENRISRRRFASYQKIIAEYSE